MSTPPKTLLVVDDDEGMRDTLAAILKRDYLVLVESSAESARAVLACTRIDLMLLDVRLPGMSGLELLKIVKDSQPLIEVIVISAVSEVETAVAAMKQGAYHYITKDFEYDALRSLVRNASEKQDLNRRVLTLSAQVAEQSDSDFVMGPSGAMREVMALAGKISKVSATVLILGESGTGKELLARWLHRHSERAEGPFIPVNVGALPADLVESTLFGHERGAFTGAVKQQLGKFELAAGGTLFLDEVGDLRLDLQVKLLRAIQEGEIERLGGSRPIKTDFRLVCATNQDLDRAVREGRFRDDLYYRINVVPIVLPALRTRSEDVKPLTEFFLERYEARFRKQGVHLAPEALAALERYTWPGNVRELQNLMERLVAINDGPITEEDLPLEVRRARDARAAESALQQAVDDFERSFLLRAIEQTDGNVTAAARALGVPLSTLKHKLQRLEINDAPRRIRRL